MAIDDIVRRIAEDAENEAASLVAEAESDAARVRDEAMAAARAEAAALLAREAADAARDAGTTVANARLAARDSMLAARQEADEEALRAATEALEGLPDGEYAALIAAGIAGVVRGGERVLLGAADESRLSAGLPKALEAAGARGVAVEGVAPGVERGAVVVGDRVRAEVSPATIVAERRAELLALVDGVLFGTED